MERAALRVRVLGGLAVDGTDEHALGSRKARTLLKVLALARGHAVPTDRLVDVVWPDTAPSRPGEQVGVLVSRLRRVLGAERIARSDAGYTLVADSLDLDELERRVAEARTALSDGRHAAARAAADASLRLARGEVLPDEDGAWLEADRALATAMVRESRWILAEAAGRAGDHLAAAAAAEAALAGDAYDEASLRTLMRAQVALRRPASALAAYARVRQRLAEDLGVSPTVDTEAVHLAVLADDAPSDESDDWEPPPGREHAAQLLDDALQRCRDLAAPGAVVLVGEPGIGKTTLLDRWLAKVATSVHVLAAIARPRGEQLPLQPVLEAFASHLAMLGPEQRGDLLADDAAVLEPLLVPGSARTPATATVVADADIGRTRLFAALRNVLVRLAATRPVVVAVDDLHLAGSATLAWLEHALDAPVPLLVVGTARRGADQLLEEPLTSIVLGPLDLRAAVAAVAGEESAEHLFERTGGHPLLLSALLHEPEAGSTTLDEAVARRTAALGDAASTVRAAAVVGASIDLDLLADVTGEAAADLLDDLERAAVAGLLVERGTGFAFRHELERLVLERQAGSARRALVHRRVSSALAARPHPDPAGIAAHARLGGDPVQAATWFAWAAEVAVTHGDLTAAEELLGESLGLVDDPSAAAARARVRIAAGRLDDAAADAEHAVAGRRDAEVLEVAGWVAYYRRRYDEALGYADEAVALATDPDVRASSLALAGRVRHGAGDLRGALDRLEASAREPASAHVGALGRVWLALARIHAGRPADALAMMPSGLADHELAHPFAPLHSRFGRVMALGQLGRVGEALRMADEFDLAVERSGAAGVRFEGVACNGRGWLLRWTGRLEEADACNEVAVERAAAANMAEAGYAGRLDLVDGALLAGDTDRAAELLGALVTIESWNGAMAWHQRHRYDLQRSRVAALDGDRDRAIELATSVLVDAGGRGARRYELLARAHVALAAGPITDVDALDEVTRELGTCAALDGWWLVAALAARSDVGSWRTRAEAMAAVVVRLSPTPEVTGRLADRILDSGR